MRACAVRARTVTTPRCETLRMVCKPLPADDPKVRQPDTTRARELLSWEPKVPLAEGLAATIEYFRAKLAKQEASARG